MKKALLFLLVLAVVLSLTATAFAIGPEMEDDSTEQSMSDQFPQGQPPRMGDQPPEMNGQLPGMNGQAPEMNGQAPGMNGQAPGMNGQFPEMNGQAPGMGSQASGMGGQAPFGGPQFPDFEAMVEQGVISQATCDAIQAYLEENRPEMGGLAPAGQAPQMNGSFPGENEGQAPADLPQPPEMNGQAPEMGGQAPGFESAVPDFSNLLQELLDAGVITRTEFEALAEALAG